MEDSRTTFSTFAQVAQRFGVSRPALYHWVELRRIPEPSGKIGNVRGFANEQMDQIREYIESLRVAGKL